MALSTRTIPALSRSIAGLFYPPYFQNVKTIGAADIDRAMDKGLYTFVVVIPPAFEKDTSKGRDAEIQMNVDATASQQASLGAGYIQNMVTNEVDRYRKDFEANNGALLRSRHPSRLQS